METTSRRRMLLNTMTVAASVLGWPRAFGAGVLTEERSVDGFDAVEWNAIGELVIEQRAAQRLRVQAEPDVLPKILTEVRQRCLYITLAPGRLQTQQPIRIDLDVRSLRTLRTLGAGTVHFGSLAGDALELDLAASGDVFVAGLTTRQLTLRMAGAGDVAIARGSVDVQRVVIAGSGHYLAPRVASHRSTVSIEGSGSVEVAVRDELDAHISGSGEISYHGAPALRQQVTGAGRVMRLER